MWFNFIVALIMTITKMRGLGSCIGGGTGEGTFRSDAASPFSWHLAKYYH